jgi:AcrR family transcriptional regulator
LLNAAAELARSGVSPSIAQVADAANISHATAYRYYPNTQSLWTDVAVARTSVEWLIADLPEEAPDRVETVIRRITEMQFSDEALWRESLRAAQDRWLAQQELDASERVPVRGTTRRDALSIAVAPLRETMASDAVDRLVQALMFTCGVEALVVARDALDLNAEAAVDVLCWSARSLIRTAINEAATPPDPMIAECPAEPNRTARPGPGRSSGSASHDRHRRRSAP